MLTVAGIIGATPLAAHASLVRISGTSMVLPDQSKMRFPTTPSVDPVSSVPWTADGPAVATKVAYTASFQGETFSAAWAYFTPAPTASDVSGFYTKACAFVAANPDNAASLKESHSTKIGKMVGRICTFTTATGPLQVLFVFNGPLLIKLAEHQVAPDVSLAPLFTTYVKTLKLAKLPKA